MTEYSLEIIEFLILLHSKNATPCRNNAKSFSPSVEFEPTYSCFKGTVTMQENRLERHFPGFH